MPPPPPPPAIFVGQCKWFSDRLGYGFITVHVGDQKGRDIFVHHSGIRPLTSTYRTLTKGEYVEFCMVQGLHGAQAVNVTGIAGGTLLCDHRTVHSSSPYPIHVAEAPVPPPPPPPPPSTAALPDEL